MTGQTIRVVLLTTSFPLRTGMASGVFVQRLVKSLPAFVRVKVVTPCDTAPAIPNNSYTLHCFRYAPRKWQLLAHQPGGIPVALKRSKVMRWLLPIFLGAMLVACFRACRKADVIHANWSVNGAIAGLVGFLLRKPVVTTLRGEDVTRAKSSKLYRWLLVGCLRSNVRLVTVSQSIYDHLACEFPDAQHKIRFLPNGINASLLNVPAVGDKPDESKPFTLLTVGSLIPRKDVTTIIEAIAQMHSPQSFKLVIVGDGPERHHLESLVEKKSLEEVVEFVGQLPPERVIEYLHDADAFILASHSEGRPNVVLESFAAGVPVVASDIEGVKELIQEGENGMGFQPGDAKELASKVEKLYQNRPLQMQFSKQGREFILQNHLLWEHVGQGYAQMYSEVIAS